MRRQPPVFATQHDCAAFGVERWLRATRAPRLSRAGNPERRTMKSMRRFQAWGAENPDRFRILAALIFAVAVMISVLTRDLRLAFLVFAIPTCVSAWLVYASYRKT